MAHRIDPDRPADPASSTWPARIPLFPLAGALLLPGGDLPLNIFEPRYLAMTEDALRGDRLIGMIQPRHTAGMLYDTGCVGRITQYQETEDGRYLITLRGVTRFTLCGVPALMPGRYLLGEIDCTPFLADGDTPPEPPAHLCRASTRALLDRFLAHENLTIDWDQAARVTETRFYTLLAMVAPLTPVEKQVLLEAPDCTERCRLLIQMVEMALAGRQSDAACDGPPSFH